MRHRAHAAAPAANPAKELAEFGQSLWLDYIRRGLIVSGELERLMREEGLSGLTSNPAIFEKAIAGGSDYEREIDSLRERGKMGAEQAYEFLAVRDIQDAAGVLRHVYEETRRRDGYVSLEVSPRVARDGARTAEEARRLWRAVGRENVMIKVPATPEGLPAIERLTMEGINVNVTLLFSQEIYERVAWSYIAGLEKRAALGEPLGAVASVASFFVSRIDSAVDALLAERLKTENNRHEVALLQSLMGKVAIANARLAYQRYKDIVASPRWRALAAKGAQMQRLLWASTSTKNPKYRDVMYVEELIGSDTVVTVPPATLEAFKDHGRPRPSLEEDVDSAYGMLDTLEQVEIKLEEVTEHVLNEGIRLFVEPYERLLRAVEGKINQPKAAKPKQ